MLTRYIIRNFFICLFTWNLLYHETESVAQKIVLRTLRQGLSVVTSSIGAYVKFNKGPDVKQLVKDMFVDINSVLYNLDNLGIDLKQNIEMMSVNMRSEAELTDKVNRDLRETFDKSINIIYMFETLYLDLLNERISNSSLQIFIEKATGIDADSPKESARHIYDIFCPHEREELKNNFLDSLLKQLHEHHHQRCKRYQSPQQYILLLSNLVAMVQLRAFLIVTTGYKLQSFYSSSDQQTVEIQQAKEIYEQRMRIFFKKVRENIHKASPEITRCSSAYNEEYSVYDMLHGILMLPTETDYDKNMVATQVRMVVKDGLLQLQLKQGKLGTQVQILPDSEKWIQLYNIRTEGYSKRATSIFQNGTWENFKIDKDMHTFTLSYLRIRIETAPHNYVVVGAKFDFQKVNLPYLWETTMIYVRLKFAEIDFDTGRINPDTAIWSNKITITPDVLTEFDDLYRTSSSGNNKYQRLKDDDDGQLISFIDSQSIYSDPRLPITGIGFHKLTDPMYGSSLSVKIEVLDMMPFVDDLLPTDNSK